MKEPIKVGDYVRIKYMYRQTKIAKITKILEKDPCYHDMQMYEIDVVHQKTNGHYPAHEIYEEDIIDYSSKIIELVEIGDYVNGCKVIDKYLSYGGENMLLDINDNDTNSHCLENNDIRSILTKENFDVMNYVIGE